MIRMNNNSLIRLVPVGREEWVSTETRINIELVCQVYLLTSIGTLGVVANILSIYIFSRQGLGDNMNLKFTALSVADFFLCLYTVMFGICGALEKLEYEDMALSPNFVYYFFAWPRMAMSRAGACITVLITVERCLCIIMPLRVKAIFSRQVIICAMCFILCIFLLILLPVYMPTQFVLTEVNNRSILDITINSDGHLFNSVALQSNVIVQFVSYSIMLLATMYLIQGLKRQSAKRRALVSSGNDTGSGQLSSKQTSQSARDVRVMKLVMLVAVIFVVFSLPELAVTIMASSSPDISLVGFQVNTLLSGWIISGVATCANSSLNILVYVKMNTAYRNTLYGLFCKKDAMVK